MTMLFIRNGVQNTDITNFKSIIRSNIIVITKLVSRILIHGGKNKPNPHSDFMLKL